MPRGNTIAQHPERAGIDALLLDGVSSEKVARRFDVDGRTLRDYRKNHLMPQAERDGLTVANVGPLRHSERLELLMSECDSFLADAKKSGNALLRDKALGRLTTAVDQLAKVQGQYQTAPQVVTNVTLMDDARTMALVGAVRRAMAAVGPDATYALERELNNVDGVQALPAGEVVDVVPDD